MITGLVTRGGIRAGAIAGLLTATTDLGAWDRFGATFCIFVIWNVVVDDIGQVSS